MSGTFLLIIRLAMVLALYGFLGWAVWTLWRDIKRQSEIMATRQIPEIKLMNRIEAEELSYQFTTPDLVIGRDQTCDLILDEKTVSAEHARLSYHHGNWWVEDLHSRNGTLLNLELVNTPAVMTSGDELQLGQVILQIEISDYIDRSSNKEFEG
jgi:pSer/pThr/pTyr-binding forkhead associated (FHA) protein